MGRNTESDTARTLIALERAALDRWAAGDPSGFLAISADDELLAYSFADEVYLMNLRDPMNYRIVYTGEWFVTLYPSFSQDGDVLYIVEHFSIVHPRWVSRIWAYDLTTARIQELISLSGWVQHVQRPPKGRSICFMRLAARGQS